MSTAPAVAERVTGNVDPVEGRCNARNRFGLHCALRSMIGSQRCYSHGGASLKGALAPNYKHGRYSKFMKLQLAQRFMETTEDPELLSLRDDVALVTERISQLLERVQSGESGAAWRQLRRYWADFRRFRTAGNVAKMQEMLELMSEPLEQGFADHAAWEELGLQLDRRARLAEQEQRRLEKMQATLTVEEAMGLLGTVLDVLKRHVTDQSILDAIGADLEQLVTLDAVPVAARSRRRR